MKIMVFTPYLPHRRVGHGGGVAVRDLLTWLAKTHEVMVVSLIRPGEDELISEVVSLGVKVSPIPFADANSRGLKKLSLLSQRLLAWLRSLRSGYPLYVEKYRQDALTKAAVAAVREFKPDAIQIEYTQLSLWAQALRQDFENRGHKLPRLILNTHELGSLPRERRAARAGNSLARFLASNEAKAWQRLQVDASHWVDTTLCVTAEDQELYEQMGGQNLQTVPLGMDLTKLKADWQPGNLDGRETYLFVGSFGHRPNVLAARLLLDEIWPLFRKRRPAAVLVMAGRGSDDFLNGLISESEQKKQGVEALGFVDDLTPHFRTCRLFVAPLPEGGGIKIKILEAMARGVPIVTTSVGAEGIARPEDNILTIAECGPSFANAMEAEVSNDELSFRKATAGRRHMEAHFSWQAIAERLSKIYAGRI
ncbi:MAG: glycosyltransferase involved in cell wall biosynthesis [Candidatus Krumholzibacteriia bacterium]|jgi:glycosyltransferase involved in cell wall biosynthesis